MSPLMQRKYLMQEAGDGAEGGSGPAASDVDWVDVDRGGDGYEDDSAPVAAPVDPPSAPEPKASQLEQAEPSPAQPSSPAQEPTAAPVAAPAQPQSAQQAQPPVQPTQPSQPPATPDPAAAAAELQQRRNDAIANLEKAYALDESQAEDMITSPEKVIPTLAAKMHANILEATVYGIMEQLPRVVEQLLEQRTQRSAAEQSFYGKWPKLVEHKDKVQQFGHAWRQLNPTAPAEQFINEVGAALHVMLKIPTEDLAPVPAPARMSPPPAPAVPGGGSRPLQSKRSDNIFALIAEEDLSDS